MAYTDYIDPGNSGGSVPTPDTQYPIKTGAINPFFICEECEEIFNDERIFYEHKYTVHPIKSPLIILKGEQIGYTKKHIFEKLIFDEIQIENCTDVLVNETDKKTPSQLKQFLSNQTNGFYKLKLNNKESTRTFEFEYLIASKISLDAIDKAFVSCFQKESLTLDDIEKFTNEARKYDDVQVYVSAYIAYLYGILAKEQHNEILTGFEDYLNKFNEASDILKDYPRSLARSICAIIAFNHNFFEITRRLAVHLPDFLNASDLIQDGALIEQIIPVIEENKLIPIDWITEKIISLSKISPNNLKSLVEYEELLKSGRIPAKDKDKMRVILARKYNQAGNKNKANELLKSLRNNPDFELIVNYISDTNNE